MNDLQSYRCCQICHTIYVILDDRKEGCPFKENHFKFKIHYIRKILSMLGIEWIVKWRS